MIRMSDSVAKIFPAFLKAQEKFDVALKDSDNPFHKSKYADFSSVLEAVAEHLHANKIAFQQHPHSEDGKIGVSTILIHESGEWISSEFSMPIPKLSFQEAGGGITYARRYALQAICGITAEDDDGNRITSAERSQSQARPAAKAPAKQDASPRNAGVQKTKPAIQQGAVQAYEVKDLQGKPETIATLEMVESIIVKFITGNKKSVADLRKYWEVNSVPINQLKDMHPEAYARVETAFKDAASKVGGE